MIKENTPLLETARLVLRKFEESDLEDIFLIYGDREANKFLPWFPLVRSEQAAEYFRDKIAPRYTQKVAYQYAIVLKEDNRAIGYVRIGDVGGSNDMGYGLRREFWHKGIAVEAGRAVCDKFRGAGYSFMTATHDIDNPNSGAVIKKLGMTYRYSYQEQWQPKDRAVTFRLYQLDFDEKAPTYIEYQTQHPCFVEQIK